MLYQIKKKDACIAAQVLSKAFIDYPIFSFILPERTYREKKINFLFTFLINLGLLYGEVLASSNKLEGVSIWIDSSAKKPFAIKILWNCLIPLSLRVNPMAVLRLIKIGLLRERIRKDILKGPYFLLDIIGVNPINQNQGYARQIIESKLKEYDNQPNPCYLETSDKENLTFYEKYNFQLYYEYQLKTLNIYGLIRKSKLSIA